MSRTRSPLRQGRGLTLALVAGALFFLGQPLAEACVEGQVTYTTIAPVRVFVPTGGTAKVTGLVRCKTDSDDWAPGSTITGGGTVLFDVRLVDEDGALDPDDIVGTDPFRVTFRRQLPVPPGFARDVRDSLSWTVQCPANQLLITGTESTGEGAPGCSDPAEGALEIDHGTSQVNTNHYPGNVAGNIGGGSKTVPMCCVLPGDSRVSQTAATRESLKTAGSSLKGACEDKNRQSQLSPAGEKRQDAFQAPCDDEIFIETTTIWAMDTLGLGSRAAAQSFHSIEVTRGSEHIPFGFANLNTFLSNPNSRPELLIFVTPRIISESGGDAKQQSTGGSVMISGPEPFIPVSGTIQPDGSFTATGTGVFAGFPGVNASFAGTLHADHLMGTYRFGANGELPGGNPLELEIEAENSEWKAFFPGVADHLLQAAEGVAMLNFTANFGGVDFSEHTLNLARHLLDADAAVRFGDIDRENPLENSAGLNVPGNSNRQDLMSDEAFAAIDAELIALADAVAGSTLVNRVQVEAAIRAAATEFGEAAVQRTLVNDLTLMAPSQALVDALLLWLQEIGTAGVMLEAIPDLLLGGEFATVSAASYDGPNLAADSIVSGFGVNLASGLELAMEVPLPTTLADTSIRITDSEGAERLAGLFFSSNGQFNFHLNPETAMGPALLTVFSGDQVIASGQVNIREVAPAIFSANASGAGVAAALFQRVAADGTVSFQNAYGDGVPGSLETAPIDLGPEGDRVFLLLFGTAIRAGITVTATVGGQDMPVTGFAASSEFVGLDQVNLELLRSLIGGGVLDVEVTVDGMTANTVTIEAQ